METERITQMRGKEDDGERQVKSGEARVGDEFRSWLPRSRRRFADQIGHIAAKKTIFKIDISKRVLDTTLAQ